MSEIVVFGAGGRAGRAAVGEGLARGHDVVAVVRDPSQYDLPGARVVAGDEITTTADAVISTAVVYGEGTDPAGFFRDSARALSGVRARFVVVRLSSLLPDVSGVLLMDAPEFPAAFREFCLAHRAGLDQLRAAPGLDWVWVSPAGDFDHHGPRRGGYRVAGHGDPASLISCADFAIGLLDEAEQPRHQREQLALTSA